MKITSKYIYWFVIGVLIVLLFQKSCMHKSGDGPGLVTILKETKIDTIPGESINRPVPQPYPVYYPKHDTIKVHDTTPGKPYPVEVIKEKLVQVEIPIVFYSDTLWLNGKGYVALKDSVQGLIASRSFDWKIFETTTSLVKLQPEKKRNKLYLGLEYKYPVNYIGAGVMLQFKNDNILKVDYGYADKQKQFGIGYYPKIKFKK